MALANRKILSFAHGQGMHTGITWNVNGAISTQYENYRRIAGKNQFILLFASANLLIFQLMWIC